MNIKEIRYKASMTQKYFAEYFGIPIGTLRKWEQGTRIPPKYVIELIKYKAEREIFNEGNSK